MPLMTRTTALRLTLAAACLCPALAAAAPQSPLRGPAVDQPARETLVTRNAMGELVQISGLAEVAAVQRLPVPDDVKQRARELELERSRAFALRLVDEIDLLREMTDASLAGDDDRARALSAELRARLDPRPTRAPLLDQLEAMLPAGQRPALREMLDGYWAAIINARAVRQGGDNADAQAERSLLAERFQRELRAAYEASLRRYQQAIDAVATAVNPTPEQREAIRSIIIDHIKATRLEATTAERRAAMRAIYDMLDEERRGLLFDYAMSIVLPEA